MNLIAFILGLAVAVMSFIAGKASGARGTDMNPITMPLGIVTGIALSWGLGGLP